MTTLPPLEQREAAGVNTLRRAICYSLHLLKTVASDAVDIAKDTSLSDSIITATFKGRITFSYEATTFFLNGSNPLRGVMRLSQEAVNHSYGNIEPGDGYPIPATIPTEVDSLEKYLIWITQLLVVTEAKLTPPKIDAVKATQGKNTNGFYIKYEYSFPFNYLAFAETNNLVEAVDYVATDPPISTTFNNNTIINNSFLVGN